MAYTPAIEVPDDGDIPLSMGEDDDNEQSPEKHAKGDAPDIEGDNPNAHA